MSEQLLRLRDVEARVGLRRSSIYLRVNEGTFPRPVRIGGATTWAASEIDAWVRRQIAARDTAPARARRRGAMRTGFSAGTLIDPA